MCIRDSRGAGGRIGLGQERHRDVGAEPAARQRRAPGPHPCLLYTSDAADERSSVDLGGRRIIKKKKYVEIGVTHSVI